MNKKNSCVCVCSPHYYNRKEERTGLNPVASPLTLRKGGQRRSDYSDRLSDFTGGGSCG